MYVAITTGPAATRQNERGMFAVIGLTEAGNTVEIARFFGRTKARELAAIKAAEYGAELV